MQQQHLMSAPLSAAGGSEPGPLLFTVGHFVPPYFGRKNESADVAAIVLAGPALDLIQTILYT
jgi:hypothetical protein